MAQVNFCGELRVEAGSEGSGVPSSSTSSHVPTIPTSRETSLESDPNRPPYHGSRGGIEEDESGRGGTKRREEIGTGPFRHRGRPPLPTPALNQMITACERSQSAPCRLRGCSNKRRPRDLPDMEDMNQMSPSMSPPHKNALVELEDPGTEGVSATPLLALTQSTEGLQETRHQPNQMDPFGSSSSSVAPTGIGCQGLGQSSALMLASCDPPFSTSDRGDFGQAESQEERSESMSESTQRPPTWEEVEELVDQALGLATDRAEVRSAQIEGRIRRLEDTVTSLQQTVAEVLRQLTTLMMSHSHPYPTQPPQSTQAPQPQHQSSPTAMETPARTLWTPPLATSEARSDVTMGDATGHAKRNAKRAPHGGRERVPQEEQFRGTPDAPRSTSSSGRHEPTTICPPIEHEATPRRFPEVQERLVRVVSVPIGGSTPRTGRVADGP